MSQSEINLTRPATDERVMQDYSLNGGYYEARGDGFLGTDQAEIVSRLGSLLERVKPEGTVRILSNPASRDFNRLEMAELSAIAAGLREEVARLGVQVTINL